MPDYQIRTLDSGGTRLASHLTQCSDDDEALAVARDLIKTGGLAHVSAGARGVDEVFVPLSARPEAAVSIK
jgi:predicted dinucleotide-binding enzyme